MPCDLSDVRSHFILELCDVVESGMPLLDHELFWSLVPESRKNQRSPILIFKFEAITHPPRIII